MNNKLVFTFIHFLRLKNIDSSTFPSQSSTFPLAFKPLLSITLSPSGLIMAIISVVSTIAGAFSFLLSFAPSFGSSPKYPIVN